MGKIRVLIVEDSPVVREYLRHIIDSDPRLRVVEAVGSGEEALRVLDRTAPDVISMDIRLPGIDGFETTRRIMSERPTPVVVVSASVEAEDLKITMNALRAGALAVVEKPVGMSHTDYATAAQRICTQLAIMSEVRVVRQRSRGSAALPAGPEAARELPPPRSGPALAPFLHRDYQAVGLVASTGGPNALSLVLSGLRADLPLPVLVVQHITASFLEGFASWLDSVAPQAVRIARDFDTPRMGHVYLAPADQHLRLERGVLRLSTGPPVCMQRPSGTVLLESLAAALGPKAIGVVMTGMGEDGAAGLLALRQAGGYTLVEDRSTAVVYGMPAAAAALDAACEQLPLGSIAGRVRELVQSGKGDR